MELTKKLKPYPELFQSFKEIKRYCLKTRDNNHLQWFTKHDVKHSQEIIHLLGQLLKPIEDTQEFLTEHELFILLASAYLHDIGMNYLKVNNISIDKLTSNESDQIRKVHAERSYDIILKVLRKVWNGMIHGNVKVGYKTLGALWFKNLTTENTEDTEDS